MVSMTYIEKYHHFGHGSIDIFIEEKEKLVISIFYIDDIILCL